MSEPRTRRRGTWWVVAGLLVTFVLICLRVGLPIYRRKQAMESLSRMGASLNVGGIGDWGPPDGTPGKDWYYARKAASALFLNKDLLGSPAQASRRVREALVVAREFSELNARVH